MVKTKKIICLLLSVIMIMSVFSIVPFTANAAEAEAAATAETEGDYEYRIFSDGTAEITHYSGGGGDVTIPSTLGGYTVKSLSRLAFNGCTDLTSIEITDTVISIGELAFQDCTGLTRVKLPNSLKSLNNQAFVGCTGLTSIVIPDSVKEIPNGAFFGCTALTSVTIGKSVTQIGSVAFRGCSSLKRIDIPSSVMLIGTQVFSDCPSLESISVDQGNRYFDSRDNCNAIIDNYNRLNYGCMNTVIPESVTSIIDYAFKGCVGLTSINIPKSVRYIGNRSFHGCTDLTSITVDPDNAEYDSRDNCNAIIEKESKELIAGCKASVIPNSVKAIGREAFSDCTGLTSLIIPASIKEIGSEAFSGCSGLTSITVLEDNSVFDSRYNCDAIIETKSNAIILGCKNTIIPDSVTSISEYAFYGCTDLMNIVIPDSVKSIGNQAFYGCTGLTSIVILDSVTSILGYSLGYYSNSRYINRKVNNFTIYGYEGSAAEKYAKDNEFTFIPLECSGVTISGSITSYIDDSDVTVKLTGTDNDFTSETKGKSEYSVADVPSGNYTLTVSKANHVTREYTVTVTDADVTQDVKILPLGDVTGDGKTNVQDCTAILRYVRKLDTLSDDQLKLGDVTGDGKVNVQDVTRILRHVRKIETLY